MSAPISGSSHAFIDLRGGSSAPADSKSLSKQGTEYVIDGGTVPTV